MNQSIILADFEADSQSGKVSILFICCLSDTSWGFDKTFKGMDCDEQFLDYTVAVENPVICFHNLPYNSTFLAKFCIHGKAIQ